MPKPIDPATGKQIRTGGRQKGQQNHVTTSAKNAILETFLALGGIERMVEWAATDSSTLGQFYTKIFSKIVERQVAVEHQGLPQPEQMSDIEVARRIAFLFSKAQHEKGLH